MLRYKTLNQFAKKLCELDATDAPNDELNITEAVSICKIFCSLSYVYGRDLSRDHLRDFILSSKRTQDIKLFKIERATSILHDKYTTPISWKRFKISKLLKLK